MFLILFLSILLYTLAMVIIKCNMIGLKKEQKTKFILIGNVIIFMITVFIGGICATGIQAPKEMVQIARNTSILLFAPINSVFLLPFLGSTISKYEQKEINERQLKKRLLMLAIFTIFAIWFEVGYIKNFQIGLLQSVKG